jgi:hypothetical protein
MNTLVDPYWWTFALASLVQFTMFVRWLYRRIRNDEINRIFIQDMATYHLPRIYELLDKLCEKQEIAHSPQTPIRWMDMGTRRR